MTSESYGSHVTAACLYTTKDDDDDDDDDENKPVWPLGLETRPGRSSTSTSATSSSRG